MRLSFFCILFGLSSVLHSQVSFTQSNDIISTKGARSGITTAIVDVNADGRDDIVRVTSRGILEVHLSSSNQKELYKIEYEAAIPDIPWSITVGNLNNEGPNEIALGTVYKGGYIFSINERNEILELQQITAKDFYSQGSNFVDIDNDGYLDWFVNDDEAVNEIFLNDSTGLLIEADDFIDMKTAKPSDNSGNYSADWVDIDDDGDLDFYVSKCRSTALSSKDPRRINQLFINDGSNNYTEKASEYGIAFGTQTWATNFGDLDNDGDLDAIVINHFDKWNLLENVRNDTFVDRVQSLDSIGGVANQCLLRDFDNNGYLDILVTGRADNLWFNQGDWNFVLEQDPFRYFETTNFSVGDINHDGFPDVYTAYSSGFNDPGKVDDILYLNDANDNNWIGFTLVGTASNRSAIGAKIKVYSESLGGQMRNVRSGESYGMMNSLNQIFGLGSDSKIDSVEVFWPSGSKDVYHDIRSGEYYTLTERTCIEQEKTIEVTNNGVVCNDGSVILTAPEGMSYNWSNRDTTQIIDVDRWGYYTVNAKEGSCAIPIPSIVLTPQNNSVYRNIIDQTTDPLCEGQSIVLTAPHAKAYTWSNGSTTRSTSVDQSGTYSLILEDNCGNEYEEVIVLDFIEATPAVINDTIFYEAGEKPRDAQLIANGENLKWYLNETEDKAIFEGDTIILSDLEETTTVFVSGETNAQFEAEVIGERDWVGTNKYSGKTVSGGMFFHVRESSTIESMEVMTDSAGIRTIEILNADRDLIFSRSYDLLPGETTLNLNVELEPGLDYFITTSKEQNLETFGFKGPNLIRSNQQTKYPYQESDLVWITNSSLGADYYLYFYNWKVKRSDLTCVSERVPVTAVLNLKSSTIEQYLGQFNLYPNPTDSQISIESMEGKIIDKVEVYDILGKQVMNVRSVNNTLTNINLSNLTKGQYLLKFTTDDKLSYTYRIVKIDK